ncbi:MAG: type II secretion system minor pseudopilin GspI [Gammaproteobacteria bacterium]|nr:type II secretion system minor pseudopilin GspI [Gammaproteobacteria bacterium]
MSSNHGFTLIEVMVALAVLAVALSALIKGAADTTANSSYLQQKSFATWVAANKISELRLKKKWLDKGKKSGTEEMAGYKWHWSSVVKATQSKEMRRLDVGVRLKAEDENPLVKLASFVIDPSLNAKAPQAAPAPNAPTR